MWVALTLTLLGPPLMLGLVVLMGYVEEYVEGPPEPVERVTDAAGTPVVLPGRSMGQVIRLDRVVPPLPREPLRDELGRPLAQ